MIRTMEGRLHNTKKHKQQNCRLFSVGFLRKYQAKADFKTVITGLSDVSEKREGADGADRAAAQPPPLENLKLFCRKPFFTKVITMICLFRLNYNTKIM